jgi:hypothetical protein
MQDPKNGRRKKDNRKRKIKVTHPRGTFLQPFK